VDTKATPVHRTGVALFVRERGVQGRLDSEGVREVEEAVFTLDQDLVSTWDRRDDLHDLSDLDLGLGGFVLFRLLFRLRLDVLPDGTGLDDVHGESSPDDVPNGSLNLRAGETGGRSDLFYRDVTGRIGGEVAHDDRTCVRVSSVSHGGPFLIGAGYLTWTDTDPGPFPQKVPGSVS